jgi:hypothetical protein
MFCGSVESGLVLRSKMSVPLLAVDEGLMTVVRPSPYVVLLLDVPEPGELLLGVPPEPRELPGVPPEPGELLPLHAATVSAAATASALSLANFLLPARRSSPRSGRRIRR